MAGEYKKEESSFIVRWPLMRLRVAARRKNGQGYSTALPNIVMYHYHHSEWSMDDTSSPISIEGYVLDLRFE